MYKYILKFIHHLSICQMRKEPHFFAYYLKFNSSTRLCRRSTKRRQTMWKVSIWWEARLRHIYSHKNKSKNSMQKKPIRFNSLHSSTHTQKSIWQTSHKQSVCYPFVLSIYEYRELEKSKKTLALCLILCQFQIVSTFFSSVGNFIRSDECNVKFVC